MGRFLSLLKLIAVLTALMFVTWDVSATFFPREVFRPFFSGRFASSVGELTFWKVFLANFFVGFLGIQLMNLFRVGKHAGGLYVLPVFWIIYGLLVGTNSFVFADSPIPFFSGGALDANRFQRVGGLHARLRGFTRVGVVGTGNVMVIAAVAGKEAEDNG